MSDSADKVGELFGCRKVSAHFDWCGVLYVQRHVFCLPLIDLQVYLLCKGVERGSLLLHVLMGV